MLFKMSPLYTHTDTHAYRGAQTQGHTDPVNSRLGEEPGQA